MRPTDFRRPSRDAGELLALNLHDTMASRGKTPAVVAARTGLPLQAVLDLPEQARQGVIDLNRLQVVADGLGVPLWLLFVPPPVASPMGKAPRQRKTAAATM